MAKKRTRRQSSKRQGSGSSMTPWLVGAGLFFLVLFALVIFLNNRNIAVVTPTVAESNEYSEEWIGRLSLGDPNATVIVQAWEDFLCPACSQWGQDIKPKLAEEYIDTGKVKLEYHHFPLSSHEPGASTASIAAECAANQDAFWPYHDQLFAQTSNGQQAFYLERLIEYAVAIDIDEEQFTACMSSQETRPAVEESLRQATELNLPSTPSILINGKRMENPFDYQAIKAEIDRLLNES